MIKLSMISGFISAIALYFNGRNKTVFSGKIIEKRFYSDGQFIFLVKVDKSILWTVKVSEQEFDSFEINEMYKFKIWQVV